MPRLSPSASLSSSKTTYSSSNIQLIISGYDDSMVHIKPNCFTQLFNQIRNV